MKKLFTIITICITSVTCSFSQTDTTSSKKTYEKNSAYIEFTNIKHDFGKIIFGEEAIHDFVFFNRGNKPLKISNVKSTCGCTIPKWSSEEIAPGESGVISVKYDSKRSGGFSKGITIFSNAANGEIILLIEGEVTTNPNKTILGEH